jgi:tetratricopeptide (TPR) repeat protein
MKTAAIAILIAALETSALAAPTAEDLYNQGQTAYDKADYPTAIADWQQSYKLSGASGLLFNLAQAYRLGGQCKKALFTYQRFIALDPAAEQRALADGFVSELTPQCGAPSPVARVESTDDGRSKRLAGIATAGAGVVLFAIGIGVGHHAGVLGDEVTRACVGPDGCDWGKEQPLDSSGHSDATIGRVLDVVGIAAIAGGAALYYLGMRDGEVSVTPVAATSRATGAVISWRTSW